MGRTNSNGVLGLFCLGALRFRMCSIRVWRILGGIWDVARGFQGLGCGVEGSFRLRAFGAIYMYVCIYIYIYIYMSQLVEAAQLWGARVITHART